MLFNTSCDRLDDYTGGADDSTLPTVTDLPIIIAHRGAQSVFPEHTLEAYPRAIKLGADFIEPDLVMTSDSVLIARHEPFLSGTTNISDLPEFAEFLTTKELDGVMVTDWFTTDLTLAQIKTLRARQSFAGRSTSFDDQFEIPTFQEIIDLATSVTTNSGNLVGLYSEMKHPLFHNDLDLPIEDETLTVLAANNLDNVDAPVFVQCFEVAPLQNLNARSSVRLVQLILTVGLDDDGNLIFDTSNGVAPALGSPYNFIRNNDSRTYEFFITAEGMEFTASYADGIDPWKPFIIPFTRDADGNVDEILPATDFVELAHANNLLVHPYTFRNEDERWSGGDARSEYFLFFDAGVDDVFTDYTLEGVNALQAWAEENVQ